MVLDALYAIFDLLFAPILGFPNLLTILLISVMLSFIIIILNKVMIKKSVRENLKTKMEELKLNLARAQKDGNKEEADKFLNDMMKLHGETMRHTLKATFVSMALILLILPWLSDRYEGLTVAVTPFEIPFIGTSLTWLYWYVLVSIAVGWILNRLLGSP